MARRTFAHLPQRQPQIVVCLGEIGLDLQRLLIVP